MDIRMSVVARVEDDLFGTVPDDIWKKYLNGEITAFWLYSNYFCKFATINLDYIVTDITEVEQVDE